MARPFSHSGAARSAVCFFAALLVCAILLPPAVASAGNVLVTVKSAFSPKDTATLLDLGLKAESLKLLNRLNHAGSAKKAGIDLRHTELFTFTDPKNAAALIQCSQTFGIDLPLKALIWQDEAGQTWLTYNDLAFIAERHGVSEKCGDTVKAMQKILDKVVKGATTQ